MPENQADTLANENLLVIAEHLATKDDFKGLENSITQLQAEAHTELNALNAKMEAKFEAMDAKLGALESRIVAKLGVLMGAMVATVAAVIKFL
jgi:hypothetical protein